MTGSGTSMSVTQVTESVTSEGPTVEQAKELAKLSRGLSPEGREGLAEDAARVRWDPGRMALAAMQWKALERAERPAKRCTKTPEQRERENRRQRLGRFRERVERVARIVEDKHGNPFGLYRYAGLPLVEDAVFRRRNPIAPPGLLDTLEDLERMAAEGCEECAECVERLGPIVRLCDALRHVRPGERDEGAATAAREALKRDMHRAWSTRMDKPGRKGGP